MWNAVNLLGPVKNRPSNLSVAIDKLMNELSVVDTDKLKKCSVSKLKRIKKAQQLVQNGKNKYECIFSLIKVNGLSKTAFTRTVKGTGKDKYYVNYKYLVYIIDTLYKYIVILNPGIMDDLLAYSRQYCDVQDLLTSKTIPIRKVLINNEATAYSEKRDSYLRNPYYRRKIYMLNLNLDELDCLYQ